MKEEPGQPPRPGAGCPPEMGEATVIDDRDYYAAQDNRRGIIPVGRVHLDRRTTLESPFFWLAGGIAIGAIGAYLILREKRRG